MQKALSARVHGFSVDSPKPGSPHDRGQSRQTLWLCLSSRSTLSDTEDDSARTVVRRCQAHESKTASGLVLLGRVDRPTEPGLSGVRNIGECPVSCQVRVKRAAAPRRGQSPMMQRRSSHANPSVSPPYNRPAAGSALGSALGSRLSARLGSNGIPAAHARESSSSPQWRARGRGRRGDDASRVTSRCLGWRAAPARR